MGRALHSITIRCGLAGLILEQVHGMGGMVPEQMVGPTARLAGCVHVRAAEEISLHVHLQDFELTLRDPIVDPLMAGIEPAHVARHGGNAGFFRNRHQQLRVRHAVRDRNFDQHMLAGAHDLLTLAKVHLRRGRQDHGIGALDALAEVAGEMRNAVFLGDFCGRILVAADQRRHLNV